MLWDILAGLPQLDMTRQQVQIRRFLLASSNGVDRVEVGSLCTCTSRRSSGHGMVRGGEVDGGVDVHDDAIPTTQNLRPSRDEVVVVVVVIVVMVVLATVQVVKVVAERCPASRVRMVTRKRSRTTKQ
jgi:hypothetical protein